MRDKKTEKELAKRYKKLASSLAAIGPIVQGTITKRVITVEPKERGGVPKSFGPYYQWTFKNAGKTVTVNLTAKQAKLFQKAIENNQRLEQTLSEMRRLSRQLCEASTEGVKKRMRPKPRTPALS